MVVRWCGGRESVLEDEGKRKVNNTKNSRASRARTRIRRKSETKKRNKITKISFSDGKQMVMGMSSENGLHEKEKTRDREIRQIQKRERLEMKSPQTRNRKATY
jgi:hypothetical protein